jgi:SAM-dependent methyltransferase
LLESRPDVVNKVIHRLRAISEAAAAAGFAYPDTDNQMEEGVFTFAKRTDEARVWSELVERAAGRRALDAGCGLGAHAQALAERFPETLLLDADPARAREAARRLGWPFHERVFCARVDDGSLEHEDLRGAFDFVQLVQVLGHVPHRAVSSTLRAMHHLLQPEGALLVAVPFAGTPTDLVFVTALDDDGKVRPRRVEPPVYDELAKNPQPGKLPVRHFCTTSIMSAFAMAGFTIDVTQPYHWFSRDTGDVFVLARKRP